LKPGTKEAIEKAGGIELIQKHMEEAAGISKIEYGLATERDPLGKYPREPGVKMDANKIPVMRGVLHYFPRALAAVAQVSFKGAEKYTWNGWESVPDGINRYGDALVRHLLKEVTEGPIDAETGFHHACHEAWNSLARLELILREKR